MNDCERNELAKQYLPLVKKIATQMYKNCGLDYEEVEGFGWEGFVLAMNTYDPAKSNMSFMSFASYGIRNAILSGINKTSRTIKISYYKQKQMKERGEELPSSISIEKNYSNEDHLSALGFEDEFLFDNPWETLVDKLKSNFEPDWVDMFCSVYGLDGHAIEKGKDIAKRLHVSGCLVTKRIKKMITFIKEDKELSSILSDLV